MKFEKVATGWRWYTAYRQGDKILLTVEGAAEKTVTNWWVFFFHFCSRCIYFLLDSFIWMTSVLFLSSLFLWDTTVYLKNTQRLKHRQTGRRGEEEMYCNITCYKWPQWCRAPPSQLTDLQLMSNSVHAEKISRVFRLESQRVKIDGNVCCWVSVLPAARDKVK